MSRAIEFENLAISSMDPSNGPACHCRRPERKFDGVSAAARRLYVATLRNRQRTQTHLSLCVLRREPDPPARHQYFSAVPPLPSSDHPRPGNRPRIRTARRAANRRLGPINRLREVFTKDKEVETRPPPPDIDELLSLIANIDWERDGPAEPGRKLAPDDPLGPGRATPSSSSRPRSMSSFEPRRKTETALRQSEERYRTILETIVDGYYEINLRGQVMFCNDALLRIFGYPRTEIDELDALSLLAPDVREHAIARLSRGSTRPENPPIPSTGRSAPATAQDHSSKPRSPSSPMSIGSPWAFAESSATSPNASARRRRNPISRSSSNVRNGWRPSAPSPAVSHTTSTTF